MAASQLLVTPHALHDAKIVPHSCVCAEGKPAIATTGSIVAGMPRATIAVDQVGWLEE